MRVLIACVLVVAVACRPASNEGSGSAPAAGTTTYTRGTPTVRVETTGARDSASADIRLAVDKSAYAAGSTAEARVTNSSALVFGYNQCSSRSFERQEARGWSAVAEPGRICTMELRLLNARETQTFRVTLPNVQPGTYRLVLHLSRQGSASAEPQSSTGVQAFSQSFRID